MQPSPSLPFPVRCAWLIAIALTVIAALSCTTRSPSNDAPTGTLSHLLGKDVDFSEVVYGTGPVISENRSLPEGYRIISAEGIHVRLVVDPVPDITVEAQQEILPLVSTSVERNVMKIATRGGSFVSSKPIVVTVHSPNIHTMLLDRAATAQVEGWTGDRLTLSAMGVSRATIGGQTKQLYLTCRGASHIDATSLTADEIDATSSEASDITLCRGQIRRANLHVQGASAITADSLQVDHAELDAVGASKILIGSTGTSNQEMDQTSTITINRSFVTTP